MREMHSELACGNIRSIPVPFFAGKLKFIPRVLLREKCKDAHFKNSHEKCWSSERDCDVIEGNSLFVCFLVAKFSGLFTLNGNGTRAGTCNRTGTIGNSGSWNLSLSRIRLF